MLLASSVSGQELGKRSLPVLLESVSGGELQEKLGEASTALRILGRLRLDRGSLASLACKAPFLGILALFIAAGLFRRVSHAVARRFLGIEALLLLPFARKDAASLNHGVDVVAGALFTASAVTASAVTAAAGSVKHGNACGIMAAAVLRVVVGTMMMSGVILPRHVLLEFIPAYRSVTVVCTPHNGVFVGTGLELGELSRGAVKFLNALVGSALVAPALEGGFTAGEVKSTSRRRAVGAVGPHEHGRAVIVLRDTVSLIPLSEAGKVAVFAASGGIHTLVVVTVIAMSTHVGSILEALASVRSMHAGSVRSVLRSLTVSMRRILRSI